MNKVAAAAYTLAGMVVTDPAAVAMANVIAVIKAKMTMRLLDGGLAATFSATTWLGFVPESFLTTNRKVAQTSAEDKRVKQKPATRIARILGKSAEGRAGARGNMTRLGTKKTASQRVRKATPGVNNTAVDLSTVGERLRKRRMEMREKMMSMAARGGGKEIECAARRRETTCWTDKRATRESAVVRSLRKTDAGEEAGEAVDGDDVDAVG